MLLHSCVADKWHSVFENLGIFRKFLGYLEIFGGILGEKTGNFQIDF